MKKISLIVGFLFCAFVSFGQNGNWQQTNLPGNTNSISQTPGPVRGNGGVIAPSFVDTSAANAAFGGNKVNSVEGTQIWNTTTKSYWFWNGYRWIEVSPSTAPCQTSLVGSATWSGTGLQYNVTPLDYYILCNFYHTAATTVTLSTADPSYDRYDIIVCDIFQTVGVVTGTPGAGVPNPINPFTQRIVATVRVPGGSTTPGGTSSTIVYNENVEWSVTSNVSGLNANSTTNTCVGTKNISVPSAANGQYIQMQNGVQLSINNYQYLNFDLRLDGALTGSPISFLTVTFYDGTTQTSLPFLVSNGSYGFNASSLNTCQKISIPIVPPFNISTFDRVKFTISGAPSVFHIDYVYLLSGASTPPVISNSWVLTGNSGTNESNNYIGTSDAKRLNFGTNNQIRAYIDTSGIDVISNDDTSQYLLSIKNKKIYQTPFPTIYQGSCIIIYDSSGYRKIKVDPDCVGGGGGNAWLLSGNSGTTAGTDFVGTTDNQDVVLKRNSIEALTIKSDSTFSQKFIVKDDNSGYLHSIQEWQSMAGVALMTFGQISGAPDAVNESPALKIIAPSEHYQVELAMVHDVGSIARSYGWYFLSDSANYEFSLTKRVNNVDLPVYTVNNSSGDMDYKFGMAVEGIMVVNNAESKIRKDYNGTTSLNIRNDNSGSSAAAQLSLTSNAGNGVVGKYSTSVSPYKILSGSDFYNYTPTGNMDFLNDNASGRIQFAAKGSSSAHLIIGGDSTVEINGGLRINNGRAAAGYVWTSTGTNGGGDWKDTLNISYLKSNSFKVDATGTVTCLGCGAIGVGNSVSSSAGASTAIGEGGTIDENSEATTITNGFGNNAIGCNDCLVGGTTSSGFANGVIAIGNANSGNEEWSITIGGSGNQTNGVASGTFAGQSLAANGLNTVVIGGHDITGDEDNTVYVPSFSITGDKLSITSGTDKSFETVTLSAGKIDVSNATVTADSKIIVTAQSCSNCGFYYISNISAGVGFRINSSNASDASTVSYLKIN